jgi:hypothetical protein
MSAFDEWVALHTGSKIDPVLRRQMRYAFNAGMERAAEIAGSTNVRLSEFPSLFHWREEIAKAIRKEIKE